MTDANQREIRIEAFDPSRHDRTGFASEVPAVDNFLRHTAGKLARAGNVRLFVTTDAAGAVVGFYALNAHSVDYAELPARFARTRPAHGSIPAAFITMIGVDARRQGEGLGGALLADALARIVQAAEAVGVAVALLDVLDDGDARAVARRKTLYESYGFQPLPSRPLRLFLPVATIRRASQAGNTSRLFDK